MTQRAWDRAQGMRDRIDPMLKMQGLEPEQFWGDLQGMLFPQDPKPDVAPEAPEDSGSIVGDTAWGAWRAGKKVVETGGQIAQETLGGAWNLGQHAGAWARDQVDGRGYTTAYDQKKRELLDLKQKYSRLHTAVMDEEIDRQKNATVEDYVGPMQGLIDTLKGDKGAKYRHQPKPGSKGEKLDQMLRAAGLTSKADLPALQQQIKAMESDLAAMESDPAAHEKRPWMQAELDPNAAREVVNEALARVESFFQSEDLDKSRADVEARDVEAANHPVVGSLEKGAEIGTRVVSFMAPGGPGAQLVKAGQGTAARALGRYAETKAGQLTSLAAGLGTEAAIRTGGDANSVGLAMALAPVFGSLSKFTDKVYGGLGDKIAKLPFGGARLASGGRMLTEGALMGVLTDAELAVIGQATGWNPDDIKNAPNLFVGAVQMAKGYWDNDPDMVEEGRKSIGASFEHHAYNMLTMGGMGALSPSQTYWYRRDNPDYVRRQMVADRARRMAKAEKRDPERVAAEKEASKLMEKQISEMEMLGFEYKDPHSGYSKPGFGRTRVYMDNGELVVEVRHAGVGKRIQRFRQHEVTGGDGKTTHPMTEDTGVEIKKPGRKRSKGDADGAKDEAYPKSVEQRYDSKTSWEQFRGKPAEQALEWLIKNAKLARNREVTLRHLSEISDGKNNTLVYRGSDGRAGTVAVDSNLDFRIRWDGTDHWVKWQPPAEAKLLPQPKLPPDSVAAILQADRVIKQAYGLPPEANLPMVRRSDLGDLPDGLRYWMELSESVGLNPAAHSMKIHQEMVAALRDPLVLSKIAQSPDIAMSKIADVAVGNSRIETLPRDIEQASYEAQMRYKEEQQKARSKRRGDEIAAKHRKQKKVEEKPGEKSDELAELESKVKEYAERGEDVPDNLMERYMRLKEEAKPQAEEKPQKSNDASESHFNKEGKERNRVREPKKATEPGPDDPTYAQQGYEKGETPYIRRLHGRMELIRQRAEAAKEAKSKRAVGDKPIMTGKASPNSMHFMDPQVRMMEEAFGKAWQRVRSKPSDVTKMAREMLDDRTSSIQGDYYRTEMIVNDLVRDVKSEDGRADLTFFLEGTGNIYRDGDTFSALRRRMSDTQLKWADRLRSEYDRLHRELVDTGYLEDGQYLKNYISHKYKNNAARKKLLSEWDNLNTKIPNDKVRRFETFEQAMREEGLEPKTPDAGYILLDYANRIAVAKANKQLVKSIMEAKTPDGKPLLRLDKDAPVEWLELNHPEFKTKDGGYYKMPPDLQKPLRKVLDNGIDASDSATLRALFNVSRFMKTHQLGMSFFHVGALMESMVQGSRNVFNVARGVRDMRDAMRLVGKMRDPKAKGFEDLRASVEDAVRHGLTVRGNSDVMRTWYNQKLDGFIRGIEQMPGGQAIAMPFKAYRAAKKGLDRFLWDYVHTGFKILRYENEWRRQVEKNAKEISGPNGEALIKQIKIDIAKRVNDEFGGQNWDRMHRLLGTQKAVDMAHLVMLSPDWTASVWKTGAGDLALLAGKGSKHTRDMRMRHLWQTAIAMPLVAQFYQLIATFGGRIPLIGDLLSMVGVSMDDEEYERWLGQDGDWLVPRRAISTWNQTGSFSRTFDAVTTVDTGYGEDGAKRVAQPMKQIRELLHNPLMDWEGFKQMAGAKLNPVVRTVWEQIADHPPLSDFASDWVDTEFRHVTENKVALRLKHIGSQFMPFSLGGNNWALTLPERKAMTKYKMKKLAVQAFTAYANGDDGTIDGRKASGKDLLRSLQTFARDGQDNRLEGYKDAIRSGLAAARSNLMDVISKALAEKDYDAAKEAMARHARLNIGDTNPADSVRKDFVRWWKEGELDYTPAEVRSILRKVEVHMKQKNPQLQRTLGALDRASDRDTKRWEQERGF